jgi:(2Fe-2S) ferredoxin
LCIQNLQYFKHLQNKLSADKNSAVKTRNQKNMYQCHVFICENSRPEGHVRGCCASKKSSEFLQNLKELCNNGKKEGTLNKKVRINKAGCLDFCEKGAVAVVYPEGIWYKGLTKEDAQEIYTSHILNGVPVERLLLKNK